MEKLKPSYIAGWNIKVMQPLRKTGWQFLKMSNIELAHDPEIALLDIYPREIKTYLMKKKNLMQN